MTIEEIMEWVSRDPAKVTLIIEAEKKIKNGTVEIAYQDGVMQHVEFRGRERVKSGQISPESLTISQR